MASEVTKYMIMISKINPIHPMQKNSKQGRRKRKTINNKQK